VNCGCIYYISIWFISTVIFTKILSVEIALLPDVVTLEQTQCHAKDLGCDPEGHRVRRCELLIWWSYYVRILKTSVLHDWVYIFFHYVEEVLRSGSTKLLERAPKNMELAMKQLKEPLRGRL